MEIEVPDGSQHVTIIYLLTKFNNNDNRRN